ncbi:phosphoenolpyruvate synthase/pyruvate phosphate dikinase [Janibacter hoylei PVAS-1]|uniref:Phosphoenolpyruvate synthase/pyruvate phosphate dikinase n=1 Tax=Janibacter hoylei PVAS-1 TaxID=1210046 RepID=K1E0Z4_9MICO|nr:phosphoenolpyruvate synthase/pyruvate phosphate dikinase [Janibacter hoylei PVAS-1]
MVVADPGQGQAHPVEADRALVHDEGSQLRREGEAHLLPGIARPPLEDRRRAVDVPLHEVPVQTGTEDHGALEVDRVADDQIAQGGAPQALRHDVEGDLAPLRLVVGDGEARAVDGDRRPVGGLVGGDGAAHRDPAGLLPRHDGDHLPELLDDPGEHQCSLLTAAVTAMSSPSRVTSVVVRRSASVMVVMPASPRTGAPAPSSAGAKWATTSSTRSAATKEAARRAPPSSSTERTPRAWSPARSAAGSMPRSPTGRASTSTPASVSRAVSAPSATATRVGAASSRTRAVGSISARVSTTTRSGWVAPSTPRTARCGSSARRVPAPTRTASRSARSRCTASRAVGPVIQRLVPSAAAVRPSRVLASFHVTYGRPVLTACSQARLTWVAASRPTPSTTSIPWSRSTSAPPPAAAVGSGTATTTRAMPASSRAVVHGPVRPAWRQGSRVTTAVPPRAASPAAASATTSAWGPPARACHPSPTGAPSASSTTHPTTGLGAVWPRPRAARSTARAIACSVVIGPCICLSVVRRGPRVQGGTPRA